MEWNGHKTQSNNFSTTASLRVGCFRLLLVAKNDRGHAGDATMFILVAGTRQNGIRHRVILCLVVVALEECRQIVAGKYGYYCPNQSA